VLIVQIGGSQPALSFVQGCLLATVQADLYDDLLGRIRNEVLALVHRRPLRGVLFDMSSLRAIDSYVFSHFVETARMTSLLGVDAMFFGFSPGVVSALMDLDLDVSDMLAFRNMDDALRHVSVSRPLPVDEDSPEEEHAPEEELDLQEELDDEMYDCAEMTGQDDDRQDDADD